MGLQKRLIFAVLLIRTPNNDILFLDQIHRTITILINLLSTSINIFDILYVNKDIVYIIILKYLFNFCQ